MAGYSRPFSSGTGKPFPGRNKLKRVKYPQISNYQLLKKIQLAFGYVFAPPKSEFYFHIILSIKHLQNNSNQYVPGITDIGHGKVWQSSKNDFADNHIKFQSKSRNYSLASLPHRKNAYLCRDVVGSNEGYRKLKVLFAAPAQVAPGLIDAPDQLTLPDQVTPGFIAAWPD